MNLTKALAAMTAAAVVTALAASGTTASAAASHPAATDSSCGRSSATYVEKHALDAVQFVSSSTGWVAGADQVLATTDSGARWTQQRHAPKADYTEVDAINAADVWVVGKRSVIRSTNGGRTWRSLPEPCAAITSVHFVSARNGFAVAGGSLLRTSNAGHSWRAIAAPAVVQSVCFTSGADGWLGARGKIYRTVDGGKTWRLTIAGPKPVKGDSRDYPVALVQCSGPDSGWAELVGPGVGMSQQEHTGYYLDNDGASRAIFAEQYYAGPHPVSRRASPGPYFAAFSSIDPSDAAFVDTCSPCGRGTSPVGIATRNGNSFARPGKASDLTWAMGAAFVSVSEGWVVGNVTNANNGRRTWKIVHTTDGGHRWTEQYAD